MKTLLFNFIIAISLYFYVYTVYEVICRPKKWECLILVTFHINLSRLANKPPHKLDHGPTKW